MSDPKKSAARRKLLLIPNLLLAISLACSVTGVTPTSTPTSPPAVSDPDVEPMTLPPAIVETYPMLGSELPLEGPFALYFNQDMNTASVEAALSGQPTLSGVITWPDEATLVFTPDMAWLPETELTITLGITAAAANGLTLPEPVTLVFITVGPLRMTHNLPLAEAAEVDPSSAVVAAFNRPLVPLGADPASLPQAFSIEPAAAGRGEWLNTSTYIFYPDPGLAGGVTYTARVNPDLTSVDGGPLEPVTEGPVTYASWTFTTASPRLISVDPQDNPKNIRLDAEFVLTFNQPMNPDSVADNFALIGPGNVSVAGEQTWNEDDSILTFTPAAWLDRGTSYQVALGGNAQSAGGTPLVMATFADFFTVSDLMVVSSDPYPGGEKSVYGSVVVNFNAPLSEGDLTVYFSLEPAVTNFGVSQNEKAVYVYGDFAPRTDYSLTIDANLSDVWGGALGEAYVLNFRTAPITPSLTLDAQMGSWVVFLTPEDKALSGQAANLRWVDIGRGTLTFDDLVRLLGPGGYDERQDYRPNDYTQWRHPLNLPADQYERIDLPLTQDGGPLSPGIYALVYQSGQIARSSPVTPIFGVVSNVHLTYKVSATDVLVWAVDLRTEQPVAEASVSIIDENGEVLALGRTDSQGVFRANIAALDDPYILTYAMLGQPGQDHFALALSTWNQGISSYEFGLPTDYSPPGIEAYIYTERPIYRPGQTVYFRAVVREAYNGRYTPADMETLRLTVYDGFGEVLTQFDLPLSAFGTVHGELVLPEDAPPGYYRLETEYGVRNFQVAAYRKPEIDLQVSFTTEAATAGGTLNATVEANYFFGAPAGNAPLTWTLYARPSHFDIPGYQTGNMDTRWMGPSWAYIGSDFGILLDEGSGETGPDGTFRLEIPLEAVENPQLYTLEVTLQDESGFPVSGRANAQVHPADTYIGVRPDAFTAQAGQEIGFEVQVAAWSGDSPGERSLRAEFSKVVWVREEPKAGEPYGYPTFVPQYTLIASVDFVTDGNGLARLAFTPPEPGTYMLQVSGDGAQTQVLLWVSGAGQAVWPNLPNQRLQLTADSDNYQPGDTAQVFIPNPLGREALALVTVERGVVLRHQILTLGEEGTTLSLPLSDEDAPNIYVSVTIIGRNGEGELDFRQGYVELLVEPVQHTLNVELLTEPTRTGPGEEVTFSIRVTDAGGSPVEGEFSLSVVDLAVLALADPNAPDILPAYYGPQPLGVRTGLALAAYARRFTFQADGLGGGGGGDLLVVDVRDEFEDTAYWNAVIITDADGEAQVTVTLPDNLTTWQIDLRGLTADTRVGEARAQVVTSKDLLVRPVTPRFVVVGDHLLLAAIAHNNTGEDIQALVSLQAEGFSLDEGGQTGQLISIPAGGRVRVEWWGTVLDVESVDLVFSARGGGLEDAARPENGPLPVLHYTAPQTFATAGTLTEGGERLELVCLPRTFDPSGGELRVEISPSLAAAMFQALDVLENSPYDSAEGILSSFLPNLEAYRALRELGVESANLEARLERTLEEGLARLLSRQNSDGGWGWSFNSRSDSYITAYALYGLTRAEAAGFLFDEEAIRDAVTFLQSGMPATSMLTQTWQFDRLAFQHYVLDEAGAGSPAGVSALYEERDRLNPWGQALLALTLESLTPGDERAATLISDLQATAIRSATGAHWEEGERSWRNMSNTIFNSSVVVYAIAQRDPASPMLPDAVRYLMAHRDAQGGWNSTYTTAWTVLALTEVIRGTGELGGEYGFSASLNDLPLLSGEAGGESLTPISTIVPLTDLFPNVPNGLIFRRDPGLGRLYYTIILQVYRPAEEAAPLNRGINVARTYYDHDDPCFANGGESPCAAVNEAQAGDLVTVRLTITLPNDVYYLMVEDYLPAGAEILDTRLKTSQQGAATPVYDPRRPFAEGWGWWLFSAPRVYDDHIAWTADYVPAGTYELTYILVLTHPGEFRVLPARAWMLYFPEVMGSGAGEVFVVGEGEG